MSDIVNLLANQEMERNPKPNNEIYTPDEYRLLLKSTINKHNDALSATMKAYLAGHFNIQLPKDFSFEKDIQFDLLTKEEAKDVLGV
jgi:hypothetical protein